MRRLPERYAVVDSRTGNVQVIYAHSQVEANTKALVRFRTGGGVIARA